MPHDSCILMCWMALGYDAVAVMLFVAISTGDIPLSSENLLPLLLLCFGVDLISSISWYKCVRFFSQEDIDCTNSVDGVLDNLH